MRKLNNINKTLTGGVFQRIAQNLLSLASQMEKLLKHILLVIVAVAFAGSADGAQCQQACGLPEDVSISADAYQTTLSETESELCLPRQVSFAGPQQVQNSARRTNSTQRSSFEFTKAGKVENAGIRYFIQTTFVITRSPLADPANILLSSGKLII